MHTARVFKFGAQGALERPNTVQVEVTEVPWSRSIISALGPSVLIPCTATCGRGTTACPCVPAPWQCCAIYRMMRELAKAFEVLTTKAPLVLVLEDLQWGDNSTVEVLAYMAQRREP